MTDTTASTLRSSDRRRATGIYMFLAFAAIFWGGSFGLQVHMALEQGRGLGIGDTRTPLQTDHQTMMHIDHPPTTDTVPHPEFTVFNEVWHIAFWLGTCALLIAFWWIMLDRIGAF